MRAHWALVAIATALAGCAEEVETESLAFRCAGGSPAGLVGLDLVDISGTPSITGAVPNVFSNELVTLSGAVDLEGSAISGGEVTISGNAQPGGDVIEYATPIAVADPTADVAAAKLANDNASIPCVAKGNKCTSVVSNDKLTLSSQQKLTLETGTYYFEGITISGQAKLDIDGAVVIYLAGGASFNGGSATNPSSDSLTVISSSTSDIKLTGGGSTNMHVFAPFSTVRFSGTQGFRGSALGKELRISGTADLEVTADLALTHGYVTCEPEPEPEPEPETSDDAGDDDGPTDPPPPQPN